MGIFENLGKVNCHSGSVLKVICSLPPLTQGSMSLWWAPRPHAASVYASTSTNKKEGGVICCVKSTLASIKIHKQDIENYDSVYVEITHNNKKLILATVYRPPKLQAVDDTALYNEIQSLIQDKNAIVIGDFNCANVDWRSLIGDQEVNLKVGGIRWSNAWPRCSSPWHQLSSLWWEGAH